jgi:RNA polymerase sigma factor (sigma-70 family)
MTLRERHARDASLVRRARSGDEVAKAELMELYDRAAWKAAIKYRSTWLAPEDLVQEARMGLLDAIARWDPERGTQFMTVAVTWCRCRAGRAARGLLTSGALRVYHRGGRVLKRLRIVLQREPTDSDLAEDLGVTEHDVAIVRFHSTRAASLDAPREIDGTGDQAKLQDVIPDTSERVDERLERDGEAARVRAAIARLNPRARHIIERRHLADEEDCASLAEIGDELGLSRERVRQIEAETLKKLAVWLEESEDAA